MTRLPILTVALLLASPAVAQDVDAPASAPDFDLAKEKVKECEGEKFEFAWGAGAHPTKVTLCSEKDADTDEIIKMIDDAATKIATVTSIPEDRRMMLAQQMRAKIDELKATRTSARASAVAPTLPTEQPATAAPSAPVARQVAAPPPVASAPARAPTAVAVAKPRLDFSCINVDFPGGGPCVTLTRDTILTVKSATALQPGASLRFVRRGEERGALALGSLRKGQSLRFSLPAGVCSGISSGEVRMEITRGGQVLGREGPYLLRC